MIEEIKDSEHLENLSKVQKPLENIELPIHNSPHIENLRLFYSLMYAENPNCSFSFTDDSGKEVYSESLSEEI